MVRNVVQGVQITPLDYPLDMRAQGALEEFIVQAFAEHHHDKFPSRWHWLYLQPGAHSIVAWDGDRIVGHVGMMPLTAREFGRPVSGAWSVDTVVLPAWRGTGIGTQLQRAASRLTPLFISLWMSEANRRIKEAMGHVGGITLSILERDIERLTALDADVSQPCAATISTAAQTYLGGSTFYVDRTAAYCDWRFVRQPNAGYRQITCAHGLAMSRVCGRTLHETGMIGDVFPARDIPACLADLVDRTAAHLRWDGCRWARYGTTRSDVRDLLQARGWRPVDVWTLYAPRRFDGPGTFMSLSDQDIDQRPW